MMSDIDVSWKGRIVAAKVIGCFSHIDRIESEKWASCAVGENIKYTEIKVSGLDANYDSKDIILLRGLGMLFYSRVCTDNIDGAEETYNQITKEVKRIVDGVKQEINEQ